METFNILDFGGDGQNKGDNIAPLEKAQKAISQCNDSSKLIFPKGEYHFYKDNAPVRVVHVSNTNSCEHPEKTIGFLVENMQNLIIDGCGSMFVFHGNMQALTIIKSTNIICKNFSWDFEVPTTVELAPIKTGFNYTDFKVPENFTYEIKGKTVTWFEESPLDGHRYWQFKNQEKSHCGVAYEKDSQKVCRISPVSCPFFMATKVRALSDHSFRVNYLFKAPAFHKKPNTIIELCQNYTRECAGALVWECKDVVFEDIHVHYMNAFGFLTQMSENVAFVRCNFLPNPQKEKRCTSFADLIHVSGAKGKIKIIDCNFSDAHDDPINIHGTFTRVVKALDDNTLMLEYVHNQQGGFPQYHIGDKVSFYSRSTLENISDEDTFFTVASCTNPKEGTNTDKTMTVTFKEKLPENIEDKINTEQKYVAENITYTPDVHIKGCHFQSIPTRGILCTTRGKVLIEENIFDSMTMSSIYISNDSNEWYESGPVRDMTIRANTFYVCKTASGKSSEKHAIFFNPITKGFATLSWEDPVHRNINICDNTFYMEHDHVLKMKSAGNVTFTGNTVKRCDSPNSDTKIVAFNFDSCKNVIIENNIYDKEIDTEPIVKNMPAEEIKMK